LGLAAASRSRSDDPGLVEEFTQTLRCGIRVVPGLVVAEQSAGMAALWPPVTKACLASAVDVIADLGRINAFSPVMGVASAADVLIVVVTPTLAGVLRLRERVHRLIEGFSQAPGRRPLVVPLVLTQERVASGDVREINQVMQATDRAVRPACYLAEDPASVARLLAGEPVTGRLGRTALIRSAGVVADQIASMVSPVRTVLS
jgi:hypothetical protein